MVAAISNLAVALSLAATPVAASRAPVAPADLGAALEDAAPAHLAMSLRQRDAEGLRALLLAQQDPASPLFHRWLTPVTFGERFGQPEAVYERVVQWALAQGFQVARSPNRLFVEATGTVGQVRALLGVRLREVRAEGGVFRTFDGTPTAPKEVADALLSIDGLDTRPRWHHRLTIGRGFNSFGPQDLRRFYGIEPLLDQGYTGRGMKLAVLGAAAAPSEMPQPEDIDYFYANVSDTSAKLVIPTIPNPNGDLDPQSGVRQELEMDAELQTVAAPGAESVTVVLPPASEIFSTGIEYIVNNLSDVAAVSTSFGSCELESQLSTQGFAAAEVLIQQGNAEGQSWFSAAGDNGADDCQNGGSPAVDFPSDIPEMTALGGTQVDNVPWDTAGALPSYDNQEQVWNMGSQGGAGGGGVSEAYKKPSWQVTTTPADGYRDLPDIALLAAPYPGVVCDNYRAGDLSPNGGTSDAAPLAAGIAALLGDRLGTRLGGINPVLYALGAAQLHGGGNKGFHDITKGDISFNGVSGASAGPGYDLASGWGSLDVAVLAASWPMPDGGGGADGGSDAGMAPRLPYAPCAVLACTNGSSCVTVPEGPSGCAVACDPAAQSGCPSGQICGATAGDAGSCIPGCHTDSDCPPSEACFACSQTCHPKGNQTALVGAPCQGQGDCPAAAYCIPESMQGQATGFTGGYCSFPCDPKGCACPANDSCLPIDTYGDYLCFANCDPAQAARGCRSDYACQPLGPQGAACLPVCQSDQDCQQGPNSQGYSCDQKTGQCVAPPPADAGAGAIAPGATPDGGSHDGGAQDAGPTAPRSHGCGCAGLPGDADWASLGLLALAVARSRRRR